MADAYPLAWPDHIARYKQGRREAGRFNTTLAGALKNVNDSLRKFASDSGKKLQSVVISSNCTLGVNRPEDPGVAVWFVWDEIHICIPVDRYRTPEANLQAIHHVLEARRTEMRHGTLALVKASFRGFMALPSPDTSSTETWWAVLGIEETASADEINAAYRDRAKQFHPDRGGRADLMAALNAARDEGLKANG